MTERDVAKSVVEFDNSSVIVTKDELNRVISSATILNADVYDDKSVHEALCLPQNEHILLECKNFIYTLRDQNEFPYKGGPFAWTDAVLSVTITDPACIKVSFECNGNFWFDVWMNSNANQKIVFDDPIVLSGMFFSKITMSGAKCFDVTCLALMDNQFRDKLKVGNKTISWKYNVHHEPVCLYRGSYLDYNLRDCFF